MRIDIVWHVDAVIFGAGRRGLRLARHLIEEGKSVTFLDSSPARASLAQSKLDCMAVTGSATDMEKLREAGCENAGIVVSVTDSDEVNLVSCGLVSASFPSVRTIATIRGLTYLSDSGTPVSLLGISNIVNPEQEASQRLYDIITSGLFCDVAYFPGAHYIVTTKTVLKGDAFVNKNLIQVKQEMPGRYLLAGVEHKGKVSTATGNTVIREGDEIAVICDDDERAEVFSYFGISFTDFNLKRIVFVGGTRICKYLLLKLPREMHKSITLVEKDGDVCKEFAEIFPDILILNGAITDENFWEEESIADSDLFASMTENDELNVIVSSYAKTQGARRTIALIKTNNNYITLAKAMGIDATVSTTEATVDAIMKILRGESVRTLHSIFDGKIEVYEYVIKPTFVHLDKSLKEINFKGTAVIGGVSRGNENFIPDGSYVFRSGDTVLVAALHKDYEYVKRLFGGL